jgi:hypothetical protein
MAKSTDMKPIGRGILGGAKKATSTKGPFGGGNGYNQMPLPQGFGNPKARKGHTQKGNTK